MLKISVIGASGSVGNYLSNLLMLGNFSPLTKLVLITHSKAGHRFLYSLKEDALLPLRNINCTVTQDEKDIQGSDVIIFCAGKAVPQNNKSHINIDNRTNLFEENKLIIEKYQDVINQYCKNALMILVTNPVSKLIQYFTDKIKIPIVGVGVTNDTLRYRAAFLEKYNNIPENLFAIGEHGNQRNLTYTLSQISFELKNRIENNENCYGKGLSKELIFSNLKKFQGELLNLEEVKETFHNLEKLPLRYKVYSKHRCAHFISKTIISTSTAILEILKAIVNENLIVSVELACFDYVETGNSVLGVPVRFINRKPQPVVLEYSDDELSVLYKCSEIYKILEEEKISE